MIAPEITDFLAPCTYRRTPRTINIMPDKSMNFVPHEILLALKVFGHLDRGLLPRGIYHVRACRAQPLRHRYLLFDKIEQSNSERGFLKLHTPPPTISPQGIRPIDRRVGRSVDGARCRSSRSRIAAAQRTGRKSCILVEIILEIIGIKGRRQKPRSVVLGLLPDHNIVHRRRLHIVHFRQPELIHQSELSRRHWRRVRRLRGQVVLRVGQEWIL